MQSLEGSGFQVRQGFNGSVANLSLVDVLQLQSQQRFTGLVRVYHGGLEGDLYLESGELVHAEVGGIWGEEAAYHVISWQSGEFHIQEHLPPPQRTITKKFTRLLLEFHHRLDEAARDVAVPAAAEPLPSITQNLSATGSRMSALSQKIVNAVPGVRRAVLIDENGSPVDDPTPEAEILAARSIYLSTMLARPLSNAFGLGELSVALLESDHDPMLVFRNRDKHLVVEAEDGTPLERVEAGIRRLLAPAKG